METNKTSVWNIAGKYGTVLGLIAIMYLLVLYFINPRLMWGWMGWLLIPMAIVLLVFAGKDRRNELGGFIKYKEALGTLFAISVIYAVFYSVFEYVLYNWIDSGLMNQVKEFSIEKTTQWMEKFGASQDKIDEVLEELEKEDYSMSFKKSLWNFAGVCIFGFILSAIVAAFIKKNPPQATA